jgi:tRNA(Phe) wybutosine-synthesizing methylase Tyw3
MIYLAKKKNKTMTKEALEQLKELNEKLIKLSDALDELIYSEMELRDKLQKVVEVLQNK